MSLPCWPLLGHPQLSAAAEPCQAWRAKHGADPVPSVPEQKRIAWAHDSYVDLIKLIPQTEASVHKVIEIYSKESLFIGRPCASRTVASCVRSLLNPRLSLVATKLSRCLQEVREFNEEAERSGSGFMEQLNGDWGLHED